jgi:hypothetical protein
LTRPKTWLGGALVLIKSPLQFQPFFRTFQYWQAKSNWTDTNPTITVVDLEEGYDLRRMK